MHKFIIDTQLPPKLARHLCKKNFESIHTTYFKNGHLLSDKQIIEIAIKQEWIVITKDNDFLDNYLLKGSPPKVLLLQIGNVVNRDLLFLLDQSFDKIIEYYNAGIDLLILNKNQLIIF
jgi:predicted nuclease of predicted toxin-antitoxin system